MNTQKKQEVSSIYPRKKSKKKEYREYEVNICVCVLHM